MQNHYKEASSINNYNLALLHQNQAMKEITINEALIKISALINKAVLKTVAIIPASLAQEGNLLLISETPDDEYVDYKSYLALFIFNEWNFIAPQKGMVFFNLDLKKWQVFEENEWKTI